MPQRIDVDQNADHVGGTFEWEVPPQCCEMLPAAVDDEKFIFVSNFTSQGGNSFYMLPITESGYLARTDGIPISHCPWCGAKINARKRYPTSPE